MDVPLICEGYMKVLATRDGFAEAMPLPLSGCNTVSVPHEQAFLYSRYGYANACSLQWYRDTEGYKVDRSIIPHSRILAGLEMVEWCVLLVSKTPPRTV